MMHLSETPKSQDAALEQLWRQVCASRGTPAPDAVGLARFMEELETHAREKLQSVLRLAARGREPPGELSLLSWAAGCTRPALLERLAAAHGLAFTGAHLFACGLRLREEGWDVQQRLAQLQSHPADVATLRALLPVKTVALGEPQAHPQEQSGPDSPEDTAVDAPFFPWPDEADDHGLPGGQAPGWEGEPMDDVPDASASNLSAALPVLPTRFARQRPEAFPSYLGFYAQIHENFRM
jgi:hypothetical protein